MSNLNFKVKNGLNVGETIVADAATGNITTSGTITTGNLIASDLSAGNVIIAAGTDNNTVSTSTGNLNLYAAGSVVVGSNLTASGDLIVTGNLTVNGTTTTVNSNTINLADNIITLNSDWTGAPSQNAGIEVNRGTSTTSALNWNETSKKWEQNRSGTSTVIPINTTELTEGTNLYYTDSRARLALSSGTGITFNQSTGVITNNITQYTDTLARAALSAGTGINYNSATGVISSYYAGTGVSLSGGFISIGQDVGTAGNVTFNTVTASQSITLSGSGTTLYNNGGVVVGGGIRVDGASIANSSGSSVITWSGTDVTTPGNAYTGGTLYLKGSSSGTVGLKGSSAAGSTVYTLPSADGTSGQVLSTNGSGTLSWATASGSAAVLPAVKSESYSSQPWSIMPGCLYIGSIGNSLTISAQTVRYHPFYVSAPITLTELGISVATASTLASCNVMIYITSVDLKASGWQPTSNLSGGYAGEISNITTTGIKSISGLSISLPAGAYLATLQFSNFTGTLQCRSMANQVVIGNGYNMATADGTTYAMTRTGVSYTSGTPATAASWSNGSYANAGAPGLVLGKWTVN